MDDVALFVAVGTLAGVLATAIATAKKGKFDGAAIVSEASLALLVPLRNRVEELEKENGILRNCQRMLVDQLRGLGEEPTCGEE